MLRWLSKKYFFLFIIIVIAFAALIFSKSYYAQKESSPALTSTQSPVPLVPTFITATSTMPETKIYRNEKWGFEFEYPKNWKLEENSFYSPFSKFNLQGDSSAENYNPFSPSFIINIVTPDFAERAFYDLKNIASETNVGEAIGLKYEYKYEGLPKIAVILPFGQYKMILGADNTYQAIFNKILTSFKFLK